MRLEFIGAAHEVTGSCHYLQVGEKHILVDCGMEQGADIYENQEIPISPSKIDYIFVTHAHIDHSGLIPLMYNHGFQGEIYATGATVRLCEIMLKDSAHIQESEAEWKNRKAQRAGQTKVTPMYTVQDAVDVLSHFVPCPYDEQLQICDEIKVTFRDAGHLLGSSFIEMEATEDGVTKRIIFSGDLGNGNRALIRDPEAPHAADYVLIESTYGDRLHEAAPDYAAALVKVLEATFQRGGNVIIPAFSVGRTQEMLYYLRRIKQEKLLSVNKDFEVYVDSPLSVEATTVFSKSVSECFRAEDKELILKGINPITFPGLRTSVTSDDSKQINLIRKPIVIISASGMCEAGRVRHHLKYNLWREECSVVFVGYQVPGTLGYQLLNGAEQVKLFGEPVSVKAQIINLPGISGHADKVHLTDWLKQMPTKPERVFVVHGEDQTTDLFAEHISREMSVSATAPYSGDVWDLVTGKQVTQGERKAVPKKSAENASGAKKSSHNSSVYDKLLAAGERLMAVIRRNKEGANKDLTRFTEDIEKLCDKWDR